MRMEEDEEGEDEELGVAETYADYMPLKCEYTAEMGTNDLKSSEEVY